MSDADELREELAAEIVSDFISLYISADKRDAEKHALAGVPDVLLRKISNLADRIRALEKAPIGD